MTIDLAQFSRIPSLPTIAVEALKLFHDADCSNDQLVSLIRKDPAIVSRLLKAANSPKYGTRDKVTDLTHAVVLLGQSTAATLVLSFSLSRQSMESSEHMEHFRRFWRRSFVQATAAEILAARCSSRSFRAECYTTSILSGLGKLALLKAEPEKYLRCLRDAQELNVPLHRIEQERFGFDTSVLTSFLLQKMGLPARCCSAIADITGTSPSTAPPDSVQDPLLEVTRVADAVASLICDDIPAIALLRLEETLAAAGLPEKLSAEDIIDHVRSQLEASAALFDIDSPRLPPASDLLQEALEQLSQLAVKADESDDTSTVPVVLLEENGRLKRRVADLLRMSRTDALTGLANRAFLLQELSERAALHRVRGLSLGLAVIDADNFKKINDTFGHQAGDLTLKVIAETLHNTLRDSDVVGRFGGEEFVAILEDSNADGLAVVGERLRSAVETAVINFEGRRIAVTVSIGLAHGPVVGPEQEFGERLFAAADAAMYRAKNSGRNCCIVESLVPDTQERCGIERGRSMPVPAIAPQRSC